MQGIEADALEFQSMLLTACRSIPREYMLLPVSGLENPQYRERVYCYELYHQLRLLLATSNSPYFVGGEIDKTGHPLIRNNHLDRVKPDLAVYIPGDMDRNLCVVEVKPINLKDDEGLADDFRKLTAFRRFGQYHSACFILYGRRPQDSVKTVSARLTASSQRRTHQADISMPSLSCYWHSDPSENPILIATKEE